MKRVIKLFLCGSMVLVSLLCTAGNQLRMYSIVAGTTSTETINYSRKTDNAYYFDGTISSYRYGVEKSCGPVAGAVTLGYYDRNYSELIPNYTSAVVNGGKVTYARANENVYKVMDELIVKMKATNGTTVSNFKSGLSGYVSSKGLKTAYTSSMDNYLLFQLFNFSKYKKEIDGGKPVILCLNGFHCADYGEVNGSTDMMIYTNIKSTHMMVGFGYRSIKYYRYETKQVWSPVWYNLFRTVSVTEEVNFKNLNLLMAETGTETYTYLNIDKNISIEDAFSVKIAA